MGDGLSVPFIVSCFTVNGKSLLISVPVTVFCRSCTSGLLLLLQRKEIQRIWKVHS